jgi:SAM-dependent methyltransferase
MADHDDLHPDEADDSGFEDDASNFSTSIASSVFNYTYENGRRYHAYRSGSYPLPNDDDEQNRMDLLHHIWKIMLEGELLLKKPNNPQRILDVGTGTGAWAIDIADENPQAMVIGTDLSPIQPGWVPPNCMFYVDDAESDWTYQSFDLIHGRSLGGSISDWPRFYRQCFGSLHDGGILEMQEHDAWISTINAELPPWTADWNVTLNQASAVFGKYLNVANDHVGWMREAGFVDVQDHVLKIPIGTWSKTRKELGRIHRAEMLGAVEPYTLALYTKVLGKSLDETKVAVEMVKKDFSENKNHLYVNYHFITARKPERHQQP